VRFGFDNNPREVKQFVNGLVSKLLVLDERVKAGLLPNTFVPNPAAVAKLALIETRWPTFAELLETRPRAADELTTRAIYPDTVVSAGLETFDDAADLLMFLRSTRLVPLDRVDLVIYGKTTTYAQAISEYSSFEQSLRSGDWPE